MVLRLLKKSEVATAKSLEKKREIDEGLKIARRVDSLREVHANEETSLESFRVKTITAIHLEIVEKTKVRDELSVAVNVLEERKRIALIPMEAELAQIELDKKTIAEEKVALINKQVQVHERELAAIKNEKDSADMVEDLKRERAQVDAFKADTITLRNEAQDIRNKAQQERETSDAENKRLSAQLDERGLAITKREKEVAKQVEQHAKDSTKLAEDRLKLNDRIATHERNIKRLTK